jgi:hypothetical protein
MLIDQLLDDLFTNGQGQIAYRLVLTSKDGRDLGGWGREVIRDRVLSYATRFYVGQRVRMTEYGLRQICPISEESKRGTVVSTWIESGFRYVRVQRDGRKTKMTFFFAHWEPIPVAEMAADETAKALVAAYTAGETNAALLLADRLIELHGGTPRTEGRP